MLDEVNKQALKLCFRAQIGGPAPEQHPARRAPTQAVHRESLGMGFTASNETSERSDTRGQKQMPIHVEKHIGRNDPCPCGSGKKYKKCHGANL